MTAAAVPVPDRAAAIVLPSYLASIPIRSVLLLAGRR
jgi:hypothetical protein